MTNNLYHDGEEAYHFPAGILMTGQFASPFGFHQHRPAGRQDWMLTYTLGGEGLFRVKDFVYTSTAGTLVVIPPGIPQHYATGDNSVWEFMWVHFLPRPHWLPWLQLPMAGEGLLALSIERESGKQRLVSAFQRLIDDNLGTSSFSGSYALHALEEIILISAEESSRTTQEKIMDPRIAELIDYMSRNSEVQHAVENLAARLSLSPSRLSHLYKDQVGETPMRTLRRFRLEQAAKWLDFTSNSITQIASDVGFNCPFHFTRIFTEHYGMPPTAYRYRKHKTQ
ncbi:helix-turn-helix domain-containing protein [Cohnella silvisoli]|uniref:Helix-turn-helix domain-containing protein n=1 Tax=Cohnella silvisoli TaxID=2873699 RepID=A0ABV1L077_9BACL|nr:helix-turn-helix domain-containing protein [Cohnella silvisoli]MCD9024878.1 helix-turn-helix domain-containing protein [Cohnella silvisoli]